MAAFVNSLSMSGSSGGMRICSALYMGPAELGSMLKNRIARAAICCYGNVESSRSRDHHVNDIVQGVAISTLRVWMGSSLSGVYTLRDF